MLTKELKEKSMRHKYKGFKENPLILTEQKIYEHQNTKKIL